MSKTDAMIAIIRKTMRIVSLTLATPCAIALVAWVFLITAYILGRAIFNVPWLFVEEFTEFWLVVIGYFAITYALVWGRHVVVDFVTSWLPRKARRGLRVATSLLALPIVVYLVWRSIEWFIKGYQRGIVTSSRLQIPFWPFYLVVVIGLSALSLGLFFEIFLSVIGLVQGRDILFEEVEEYF
jgi:TRAP-type C4-dicarboxylate transport system permease small subunit